MSKLTSKPTDHAPPTGGLTAAERELSLLGGVGLLVLGLSREKIGAAVVIATAGAGLLARGITGRSTIYRLLEGWPPGPRRDVSTTR